MQDWKMMDRKIKRVENAGLKFNGLKRRAGKCRTVFSSPAF